MSTPDFFNPETMTPPLGPYSHGGWARAGSDILYIAGQVGVRPDGTLPPTIAEQADGAYENIARVLAATGLTAANIVKINTFCVAGQDPAAFRDARRKALGDIRPAATFVFVAQLIDPRCLIEIEAIAVR